LLIISAAKIVKKSERCASFGLFLSLTLRLAHDAAVLGCYQVLHLAHLVLVDGGHLLVPIIKVKMDDVGGQFLFGVAHAEHGCPHLHALELILEGIAALIAFQDATRLPCLDLVQELTAGDSYLAYEQLV